MPTIRQLPTSVINKIAAGEVIERPSSVVKELVENSVDAGSTRIDVTLEKGGNDLVRVVDNGCGIDPDQLLLAVASHATSKINDADDLFRVGTLGFRGEALASISEVSQFLIRSRTPNGPSGYQLEVNGGSYGEIVPCGSPIGTVIEVRNLFFNTPVRRKFLKSIQTELGHISEAFMRVALPYTKVHFTLSHNGKIVHELPPCDSWSERIGALFGQEIRDALIPVSAEDGAIRLSGFVVDPNHSRSHNKMQYLFLNGRHIRDRSLQHALSEAYRGLLLTGRFPIAFLRLEMPADLVDVNVHPAKLEVRFQDSGRLYSQMLGAIRQKFLSTDLTAKVRLQVNSGNAPTAAPNSETTPFSMAPAQTTSYVPSSGQSNRDQFNSFMSRANPTSAIAERGGEYATSTSVPAPAAREQELPFRQELPSWEKLQALSERTQGSSPVSLPLESYSPNISPPASTPLVRRELPSERFELPSDSFAAPNELTSTSDVEVRFAIADESGTTQTYATARSDAPHSNRELLQNGAQRLVGMQIHNRYLIAESPEGMLVIDQHALHERVLYERLKEKVANKRLESQRLLVPMVVTLTPAEAATAIDSQEMLAQVGLEIESLGGSTISIQSYPAMLAQKDIVDIFRQVVDEILSAGRKPQQKDLIDELLHMMSCKAAVKAGDRLTQEEISLLLEHRELCQDSHHCPHGRPTALVFSREELDRKFKRI